jgi:hypothetical protein
VITGAEIAVAAKALVLAGIMTCDAAPAPVVRVALEEAPPVVTHRLSHEELGKFQTDTRIVQHRHEVFVTGGVTESKVETAFDMSFNKLTSTYSRESCLAVREINVKISYAPVVHIAKNFPQGSCRYNQTWQHELRHVGTDLVTLRGFVPFYRQALEAVAATFRNEGPLTEDEARAMQEAFGSKIREAVVRVSGQMDKTRMQRQQLIDTREEYLRLSRACPEP